MSICPTYFTEKSQMFKGYFLLLKISYLISTGLLLGLFSRELSGIPFLIFGLAMLGGEFAAAIFAERLIKEDNQLGLFIGLVLALMTTFSMFFPIGLFGLYSLLNKDFRNDYLLSDRPQWLISLYERLDSPKGT